jgi:RNA polymerase sigma-70 factor (ECF subfamily)
VDAGDEGLLARISAGEHGALEQLYDRHAGVLLALAQHIVGDAAAAEELVEGLFLDVWRDPTLFRRPLRGSLVAEMRRRALARGRPAAAGPPAVAPVLADFPDEERRFLELSFFQGLSAAAIAARTDTPVEVVRSRIAAALALLRVKLAGAG